MLSFVFAALFFITIQCFVLCYLISQAVCARIAGVAVLRVDLGYGKYLIGFKGRYWDWALGIIPFGGAVRFSSSNRDECKSRHSNDMIEPNLCNSNDWESAPKKLRLTILLIGPFVLFAIAIILLTIPVFLESRQMILSPAHLENFAPSGINGLGVADAPATLRGQLKFSADVIVQGAQRFMFFQPLDGWSGIFGWLVTSGTVGSKSFAAWITLTGLAALTLGLSNMLLFNSSNYLSTLFENQNSPECFKFYAIVLSVVWTLFLLSVCIRIFYADFVWILKLWH